ncbi:hypothetical protein F-M6_0004 [Faustovirus]|nr:hypothetical protein F-M6_0004 [Faustovirus]
MESMDVVPVMWYDMLPREIWAEIGMADWMTYKVAVRLNKALNAMLRDVDIKTRYAAKVDEIEEKDGLIVYYGWQMPDSSWLIKYKRRTYSVEICERGKLKKSYNFSHIYRMWADDMIWEIHDIVRYHYQDGYCRFKERIEQMHGQMIVIRIEYRNRVEIARDTYYTDRSTILHRSVANGTWRGRDIATYGFEWRIKCPGFFVWFN